MTVIVKHNKTNTITDWTQAQLDEQIALGNFPSGTTLANIVLPSDWNNDHTLTGVGTMAEQNANTVAITGGSINGTTIGATTASTGAFTSVTTPSVTATTNDLTLSAISTGAVNIAANGANQFKVGETVISNAVNYVSTFGNSAGAAPRLLVRGADTDISFLYSTKGAGSHVFRTNETNQTQFQITHTASAVNYVQVTGATTGNNPSVSAQGSDATTSLQLAAKGGGTVTFATNGVGSAGQFVVSHTASSVNYYTATGGAAGFAPRMFMTGSDTNISMAFQPKGTGAIDLAAGSSGVNISNGGTVTAITRTASGANYTSKPTLTISAPTTAGGVQAVATIDWMTNNGATVQAGGTGYTVGDVLTVVGGTPFGGGAATLTVSAVSSGVVTAVTATNFGSYSTLPTNPVSTTGGAGTGCTLNLIYNMGTTFTFSNAGSGYIEQPTVTFSGGGGSGAAAFAGVGTPPNIKSLSNQFGFQTSMGTALSLQNYGANQTTNYFSLFASATGNPAIIEPRGDTNVDAVLSSRGTGTVRFYTNGFSSGSAPEQMRVAHTASAVNYVQVTGSVTGGQPTISAQGSDTNVILNVASKNNSPILFFANGSEQFRAGQTGTAVNSLLLTGATTGLGPTLSSRGSDTNINLNFATKGTGGLLFYTNNGANVQFQILDRVSSVNYYSTRGAATGSSPTLSVVGSDTNIDLELTPKGTGRVKFGTYTGTILTPTGYVEIVDSGGTVRRLLVG
jgi:hypothetical protein